MKWTNFIKKFEKYDDPQDDEEPFDFASDLSPKDLKTNQNKIDDNDESIEQLKRSLSAMFKNSGFTNFTIENHDMDFVFEIVLNKTETFPRLVSLVGLMKKINKDILVNYEVVIDLWFTTDKRPLFTVDFYYKEGGSKKNFEWSDDLPF